MISGSLRNISMSSANAANVYVGSAMGMSFMSGFIRNHRRKGSKVSMNRIGETRQPCLVPLWMEKAFDRWPLTQTLAVGVVIKLNMRFWSPF